MYRRIKVYEQYQQLPGSRNQSPVSFIGGVGMCWCDVGEILRKRGLKEHPAWGMKAPGKKVFIPTKSRFFFTEQGWKLYGKYILGDIQTCGIKARVLSVKHRSVDVVYKDRWQVAVVKRKPKQGKRQEGF